MEDRNGIIESLKDLGADEWEIVKDGIKDALNQFAPIVLAEAKSAVTMAADLALPGTAKKEVAFGQIVENLAGRGIVIGVQVAVSMIYKMIERAFEWFMECIVGISPGAPDTGMAFGTN